MVKIKEFCMNQIALFDYGQLSADVVPKFMVEENNIDLRGRRLTEDVLSMGGSLIAVKGMLPHGQFTIWLGVRFGMTDRTAQKFMNVYEEFGKKSEVASLFKTEVLCLLAAPSTPDEVIDQATTLAESGQTVTVKEVQELKRQAKRAEEEKEKFRQDLSKQQKTYLKDMEESGARIRDLNAQEIKLQEELKELKSHPAKTVEIIIEKEVIPPGFSSVQEAIQAKELEFQQLIKDKETDFKQLQKEIQKAEKEKIKLKGEIASIDCSEKEHTDFLRNKRRVLFGFANRAKKFLTDSQEAQLMMATPGMTADIHNELAAIRDSVRGIAMVIDHALRPDIEIQQ